MTEVVIEIKKIDQYLDTQVSTSGFIHYWNDIIIFNNDLGFFSSHCLSCHLMWAHRKCNFQMNPHVRRLVGWLVGQMVG